MISVNKAIGFSSLLILSGNILVGCSSPTPEQEVKTQLSRVHALNDQERILADANAKKFFERKWPTNLENKTVQGTFIGCRPSDSNANGFVTCTGYAADVDSGNLVEVKRYCGYKPELVGCSDEDTVK
jgi:hypothetical protein